MAEDDTRRILEMIRTGKRIKEPFLNGIEEVNTHKREGQCSKNSSESNSSEIAIEVQNTSRNPNEGGERNREQLIDIQEPANLIRLHLESNGLQVRDTQRDKGSELGCIYKVPKSMAAVNQKAYIPNLMSIGPYHHGSPSLEKIEEKKKLLLKLNPWSKEEQTWKAYVEEMNPLEPRARSCYRDLEIEMGKKEFLEMLFLDSFFVLGLLYPRPGDQSPSKLTRHEETKIWCDLLMLENQMPFFVIKTICKLQAKYEGVDAKREVSLLKDGFAGVMELFLRKLSIPIPIRAQDRPKKFKHLVHLLYLYFKPTKTDPLRKPSCCCDLFQLICRCFRPKKQLDLTTFQGNAPYRTFQLYRATHYHDEGVEFQQKKPDPHTQHSLLDITLCKNVLEIPRLHIDEMTECLFSNLVAFEQTHPDNEEVGNEFTAYIVFMAHLMATAEDVSLLAKKGIIQHELRSDEDVLSLFKSLATGLVFDFHSHHRLWPVAEELELWHWSLEKWWVKFKKRHFSSPFGWFGTLVATIFFVCAVLQAVFGVLSYLEQANAGNSPPNATKASTMWAFLP